MKTGYKKLKAPKAVKAGYLGDAPFDDRPMVSIDSKHLPEIKDWKVDGEYEVTMKLKMTGVHKRYEGAGLCGDFKIESVTTKG